MLQGPFNVAAPGRDIASLPLEAWLALQARLLDVERDAGLARAAAALGSSDVSALEAEGVVLPRLQVADATTGLFGRSVVRLEDHLGRGLPAHRFAPGDIVGVRLLGQGGRSGGASAPLSGDARSSYDASGVVTAADERAVTVALDEGDGGGEGIAEHSSVSFGDRVRLDRLADDVTFVRYKAALAALSAHRHGPASRLLRLLFLPARSGNGGVGVALPSDEAPRFLSAVPPVPGARVRGGNAAAAAAGAVEAEAAAVATASSLPFAGAAAPAFAAAANEPEASTAAAVSDVNTTGERDDCAFLEWTPFRRGLNASQCSAISSALRALDVCMIHGPPGTGKTTTVCEYIRQEVARGRRVLATAPSNIAVDNLLERLAGSGMRVVRLGHPARVSAALLPHTLEAQLTRAKGSAIVADVRRDLVRVAGEIKRARDKATRRELRGEERRLRGEVRVREERVLGDLLRGADVVLATATGAATRVLMRALEASPHALGGRRTGDVPPHFDVCVIDEVAQALEVACVIPLLFAPKLVVAGDHKQLPPTIMSEEAAAEGLGFTLAERIVQLYGDGGASGNAPPPLRTPAPVVHLLQVQYRMHEVISDWSSKALYGGMLQPHASVRHHLLDDLPLSRFPSGMRAGAENTVSVDGGSTAVNDAPDDVPAVVISASDLAALRLAASNSARDALADAAATSEGGHFPRAVGGGGLQRQQLAESPRFHRGHAMDPLTASAVVAATASSAASRALDLHIDMAALNAPMLFVDTAGCDMEETRDDAVPLSHGRGGGSKANVGEADIVVKHVLALVVGCGLLESQIGVITPYNAQATLLRALLRPRFPTLAVSTVDGFQGMEQEAIILSCVRSNTARNVGFLAEPRRMNVAVTRARRHVCIIADSDTVSADLFLARLLAHAHERGEVRSALDYREVERGAVVPPPVSGAVTHRSSVLVQQQLPRQQQQSTKASVKTLRAVRLEHIAAQRHVREAQAASWLGVIDAQLRQFMAACDALDLTLPIASVQVAGIALPRNLPPPFHALELAFSVGNAGVPTARAVYPPGLLSPLQRALVHSAAEALGLPHASAGDGAARFIAVDYASPSRRAELCAAAAVAGKQRIPGVADIGKLELAHAGSGADCAPEDHRGEVVSLVARFSSDDNEEAGESNASDSSYGVPVAEPPAAGGANPSAILQLQVAATTQAVPLEAGTQSAPALNSSSTNGSAVLQKQTRGHASGEGEGRALGCSSGTSSGISSGTSSGTSSSQLLAQLAQGRAARASAAVPSPSGAADDGGLLAAALAASRKKKGGGKAHAGVGQAAAPNRALGVAGEHRELGVRVVPLKALQASLSHGGSDNRGGVGDDNDDALLDALIAEAKTCPATGCSRSTATTGSTCPHCRLRFCYAHGMPEVHGCGGGARAAARSAWLAGAGTASVAGSKGGVVGTAARGALQRELEKRIEEAGDGRKRKPNA